MKLTKITSDGQKVQHYSGNDHFKRIEIFNNDWYKICTKNNNENIINRETGNLFSVKWWQYIKPFSEHFFSALDFKQKWHVISFDGKKDVTIPDFSFYSTILEVDENLLFIEYVKDHKRHFIETDNFTEVYKKGIINESESIEFNPIKFLNLNKDYLLIQNEPKDCFVINKQSNLIIKKLKNARIIDSDLFELKFDSMCTLINRNTLELSPLYWNFFSLNKNYCFAVLDKKERLGTIMNLTDFSLPDPALLIPYSDTYPVDDNFILYTKDDDLYILN